jgi:cellulose synthase operon protein C
MLAQSRILEPLEKVDPYQRWAIGKDELAGQLLLLQDVRDKEELEKRLRLLVTANEAKSRTPSGRLSVMAGALSLSSRARRTFMVELLGQVGPLLEETKDAEDVDVFQMHGALLERALVLAADAGRFDQIKDLAGRSHDWLKKALAKGKPHLGGGLARECVRSLRELGPRDKAKGLLNQFAAMLPDEKGLARMRTEYADRWTVALETLLPLASAGVSIGQTKQASPILAEARSLLLGTQKPIDRPLAPAFRARLACAYVAALGAFPVEERGNRMIELLKEMGKITDSLTTSTHYSSLHLMIIDAMAFSFEPVEWRAERPRE